MHITTWTLRLYDLQNHCDYFKIISILFIYFIYLSKTPLSGTSFKLCSAIRMTLQNEDLPSNETFLDHLHRHECKHDLMIMLIITIIILLIILLIITLIILLILTLIPWFIKKHYKKIIFFKKQIIYNIFFQIILFELNIIFTQSIDGTLNISINILHEHHSKRRSSLIY